MVTPRTLAEMAALAFLILGFGHYLSPRFVGRELHRLEAYVLGVALGIWAPVAAVSWLEDLGWEFLAAVVAVSAGAGLGTALAWTLDAVGGAGGIVEWSRRVKNAAGVKGGRNGSPESNDGQGRVGD